MTFAILKTIMPKDCGDCLFCRYEDKKCVIAEREMLNETDVDRHYMNCTKPEWCPFVPIPARRETQVYWKSVGIGNIPTHEISDYDKGWNDCVEMLENADEC